MNRYVTHGLNVDSQLDLPAARGRTEGAPDLVLRLGEPCPDLAWPDAGQLVAEVEDAAGFGYRIASGPDGHLLRLEGRLDVELDGAITAGVIRPVVGVEPGIVTVLTGGFVLAAALALRGVAVLHASAVEFEGRAIALVGSSGQGKSTLVATMLEAGGRLVSEDVLRVDPEGRSWACRLGSTEVRLRPKAWEIGERLESAETRTTADGRLAVRPTLSTIDRLPLDCVLVPHPVHAAAQTLMTRLAGTAALAELLRHPRIPGWFGGPVPGRQFELNAALAATVPVFRLTVPWGPPFPADLGRTILTAIQEAPRG